jgi:hypothetical protein
MKQAPEYYRTRGSRDMGNNGFFIFPHYKVDNYEIRFQISDGEGWEHVSVTIGAKGKAATRCPTWDEMCWVKSQFWNEDECVIEYHPPKSEYVSCHPFCLHLWKPIGIELPLPNSIFVGPAEFKK